MRSTDTASTGFTIDETTHTIRFVRDIEASPARVFAAWTEPEQVALWWDATGAKLAACEIDLRPGGAFRFVTNRLPVSIPKFYFQHCWLSKPTAQPGRSCSPNEPGARA
jgi:hypothetical protein